MKPARSIQTRIVAGKLLAAFGASFLVFSFALAVLEPPFQSLGDLLGELDPDLVPVLDAPPGDGMAGQFWEHALVPILVRPDWLVPTMLGLICVGLAAQLTWSKPK